MCHSYKGIPYLALVLTLPMHAMEYHMQTRSIPCLLMSWFLALQEHQQLCYWPTNQFAVFYDCMRNDFNYLHSALFSASGNDMTTFQYVKRNNIGFPYCPCFSHSMVPLGHNQSMMLPLAVLTPCDLVEIIFIQINFVIVFLYIQIHLSTEFQCQ